MSRLLLIAGLVILLADLAGPGPARAQTRTFTPVSDAVLAGPSDGDWLSWRRTLDGWGFSPLDQIDLQNVGTLQLVWSWGLEPGISQTTPLIHDGVMYVANPGSVVHALDAATGDLIWEYRREMDEAVRPNQQMRSLAIFEDMIVLNTADAHIVALDARTGALRWDAATAPPATSRSFTSGPLVADGVVISGMTGCGRGNGSCYIVGVDGRTGREMWRTSTIALPDEPGGETWGGVPVLSRMGSDPWITGSYDPVLGLVYWGTAQAKPWSRAARGTGGGVELYTNSTLALDPRTGALRWFYQHVPAESHDMDEAFERILVDYDGKRSVFTMGKLGILWELDRVTGEFSKAADLGYQTLIDVDPETGRVTYRPGMLSEVGESIHFCPSTGGFKSLRAMAYHPQTQAFYVPLHLTCETAAFLATGGVSDRVNHFHPQSPDELGEFAALDLRTGQRRWSHRRRAPYNTSALTTGGGLVFVGAWDRYVFAYDADSGRELWQTRLPTMANGSPVSYSVGGKQYLAFVAGPSSPGTSWAGVLPRDLTPDMRNPRAGSGIYVFALP